MRDGVLAFEVIAPGLLTTVVDLGRPGFGHLGVPIGGACDTASLEHANALVGNQPDAAALEGTLLGPELRAVRDVVIAVAGADFDALIQPGARRIAPGSTVNVAAGETLILPGPPEVGARVYVAVAGGFDVPIVLGSRSTCLVAGFGGFKGRALRAGDALAIGSLLVDADAGSTRSGAPQSRHRTVRVLPGPDATADALDALTSRSWEISPASDRRGVRLTGTPIPAPSASGGRLSIGVLPGTIQLPPDGQPIALLADAQPTGGYPVIGVVIEADLPVIGQLAAAETLNFELVDLAGARAASRGHRDFTPRPWRDRTSS